MSGEGDGEFAGEVRGQRRLDAAASLAFG